jgi:hypothetical protein
MSRSFDRALSPSAAKLALTLRWIQEMIMRVLTKSFIAALTILSTSAAANAQSVRLRGTIETVSGEGFTMRTKAGEEANVRLKAPYQIGALVKAQLSDIKPGAFIGTAAMPGPDGTLKAMEVHIFPEAMRGLGEGSRPFDLAPQSSMTNGNISALVDSVDGPKLTVTYKGGQQTVIVDKATPIVAVAVGGLDDLKPNAEVIVFASGKATDGAYEAARLNVGRDSVKLPM